MIKRPLCMASVLFLGIQAILVGRFHLASDWKPSRLEKSIESKAQVVLGGTVYRREEKAEYEVLYLKNNQVHLKNQIFQESKILVYIKTKNQALIGNHIQISGEAGIFQGARNPGNFDQKFYYRKEGIHVYVWADEMKVRNASVNIVSENLALIRRKWKAMLTEYLGEYYGNSMSAILLGDKADLDSNVRDLYQKSGIGHILAISGVKTLKLDIPLVPETRINWAFVPLHIAIIYILKLCLDEEIIPRCRFPCSRGYFTKCIN